MLDIRGRSEESRSIRRSFGAIFLMLFILVLATACRQTDETTGSGREGSSEPQTGETPYLRISHDSGIYPGTSITVEIEAPEGYRVAATTDGVAPGPDNDSGESFLTLTLNAGEGGYLVENRDLMLLPGISVPIWENAELPQGRVLCAALLDPSGSVVLQETRVYFFGSDFYARFPDCLVVSIYTDPENLLDYDRGILAAGAVFDQWKKTETEKNTLDQRDRWEYQGNFSQSGKAWERPCLVQIYDGNNVPSAEENAGIRVRGNMSRAFSQKSFNLYFRKDYGEKRLDYELFEGIGEYKSFSLNAGGNNTEYLKFKEAFLKSMISDLDVAMLASRTAVLFLNGEYWGPYMLTEKLSDQMFEDHFGVDADQVVVVKDGEIEVGRDEDIGLYRALEAFAEKDLADPEAYRQFCETVDIQSFADYCAARIYIGDADWRWGKNDVLWRSRDDSFRSGKWQFIAYDIEYSSSLYSSGLTSFRTDHFSLALENYPLLAAALRNGDFRSLFMETLKKIGSENFEKTRVSEALLDWNAKWTPLLTDYYRRYGVDPYFWRSSLSGTAEFFENRYEYLIPYTEEWYAQQP